MLLRCPKCHGYSASRMPTAAALDAYYAHYYQPDQDEKVTLDNVGKWAARIARFAPAGDVLRILDFGGGDGSLAVAIGKVLGRPTRIVLIDHNDKPCQPGIVALKPGEWPQEKFDLIVASAVLEHIPELGPTLQRLAGYLDEGGKMYVRTPAMVDVARLTRADLCFPGHVHDLGQAFWDSASRLLGPDYRVEHSRPSAVETTFARHPVRTLAAYVLKAPWWVLGRRYGLVGGWEAVIARA